ncbi:phosphonate C-P lyase system protein PhnL [Glaciimonas sp. CA11.2]|uniref:phosphonate C-P lyase system protein PhnL n=1 Tax=unclassified Glaciimonas TaxID=2644401 RepID=UPI002AB58459|nr:MULTISPECIES: phosphonate C-P lyase system protein PhnL [unclassified Glaciimonas]MDY7546326.1 phosphonate C-P lyase system protein PhnL [Glaciimonas sp. CA11.2]MEB0010725.1 phosphonate C-P lyase system protein PhnL [Glaciimonas sp. Cout2]MEB0082139.1 phosphonate C-P lyase system protein PhnL [Glaciimonas sp. Gout2]MEB0161775.1 phosphonate C-P lyase system protein PhnL [Glaciimonas sp. CA11.2]
MHSLRRIEARQLSKAFVLHLQGGLHMPIFSDVDMDVDAGECVVIHAPSGAGKSTLLRCLYANYRASSGSVKIRHTLEDGADADWVDLATASPQQIHAVRKTTLGFVTQFLRVIPRISTLDLVAEPLIVKGVEVDEAKDQAKAWLSRLKIPARLWQVPPATFSGGEQQRVNIARTLISDFPILLLDEPTASLDEGNRDTVIAMIQEACDRGTAVVGIFHDEYVRRALATRLFPLAAIQSVELAT